MNPLSEAAFAALVAFPLVDLALTWCRFPAWTRIHIHHNPPPR